MTRIRFFYQEMQLVCALNISPCVTGYLVVVLVQDVTVLTIRRIETPFMSYIMFHIGNALTCKCAAGRGWCEQGRVSLHLERLGNWRGCFWSNESERKYHCKQKLSANNENIVLIFYVYISSITPEDGTNACAEQAGQTCSGSGLTDMNFENET